jgi:oligoendopeptidase F
MHIDRERVGITWAQFGHLYAAYYVYQYATGISAANALARRIVDGDTTAAHRYVEFLGTGSAQYPVEALRHAGVDMTQPEPVETAFGVLAEYVDRLEQLTR